MTMVVPGFNASFAHFSTHFGSSRPYGGLQNTVSQAQSASNPECSGVWWRSHFALESVDRMLDYTGNVEEQLMDLSDLTNEFHAALPVRQLLSEEGVEDGARGIKGLEAVFDVEGAEDVVGVADR